MKPTRKLLAVFFTALLCAVAVPQVGERLAGPAHGAENMAALECQCVELANPYCPCCSQCLRCYTIDGEPAASTCRCVDEAGNFTYCHCNCPFPNPLYGTDTQGAQKWITCGCACHDTENLPALMPINEQETIVYTYGELKYAIEQGPWTTIFIGYCATQAIGEAVNNGVIEYLGASSPADTAYIHVPAHKPELTIIGVDPQNGRRAQLVLPDASAARSIILADARSQRIVIAHVDIIGRLVAQSSHPAGTIDFAFIDVNWLVN